MEGVLFPFSIVHFLTLLLFIKAFRDCYRTIQFNAPAAGCWISPIIILYLYLSGMVLVLVS